MDQSLSDLNVAKQNKSKFWKTRWDSCDNSMPHLITCNIGQHFAGNSFPFDVIVFCNVVRSWHLAVNSFIVRWKWWMKRKCQNLNQCPDVSGLCPSPVECSLWVAPRFQVMNLNLKVTFCTRARTLNKVKISIEAARLACPESKRWGAFPISSSICSHRRVWSRGPERRLWYVR